MPESKELKTLKETLDTKIQRLAVKVQGLQEQLNKGLPLSRDVRNFIRTEVTSAWKLVETRLDTREETFNELCDESLDGLAIAKRFRTVTRLTRVFRDPKEVLIVAMRQPDSDGKPKFSYREIARIFKRLGWKPTTAAGIYMLHQRILAREQRLKEEDVEPITWARNRSTKPEPKLSQHNVPAE